MDEGYSSGREIASGEVWKLLPTEDPESGNYT